MHRNIKSESLLVASDGLLRLAKFLVWQLTSLLHSSKLVLEPWLHGSRYTFSCTNAWAVAVKVSAIVCRI